MSNIIRDTRLANAGMTPRIAVGDRSYPEHDYVHPHSLARVLMGAVVEQPNAVYKNTSRHRPMPIKTLHARPRPRPLQDNTLHKGLHPGGRPKDVKAECTQCSRIFNPPTQCNTLILILVRNGKDVPISGDTLMKPFR